MPPKGSYAGRILRVDLSTGKVEKKDLDLGFAHKHIGEGGLPPFTCTTKCPPRCPLSTPQTA